MKDFSRVGTPRFGIKRPNLPKPLFRVSVTCFLCSASYEVEQGDDVAVFSIGNEPVGEFQTCDNSMGLKPFIGAR